MEGFCGNCKIAFTTISLYNIHNILSKNICTFSTIEIDGSEALCQIARSLTGLPVRYLDFRNYTPVEGEVYEGIWACASLLHLQKCELLPVMKVLSQAMIPGGAFYVSFKYGNFEGERNGRHFTDFTLEEFREFIKNIPELSVAEYWVTGDVRPGRGMRDG